METTPKELLILRHAKSSWKDGGLSDHERPLNKRGLRDAPEVARYLQETGWLPEAVFCSTATRARETTAALLAGCEIDPACVEYLDDLYLAPPEAYVRELRRLEEDVARALVVGHNPGLESLLYQLTGEAVPLPTAALARVVLRAGQWREVSLDHRSTLASLRRPKDASA